MINNLLHSLEHLNIEIKLKNENISLIYEDGVLHQDLKQIIKQSKTSLIKRLKENDLAREKGFLIYNYGQLYEYRYGMGAYLFIERELDNDTRASAWRANYNDENKLYKITTILTNARFDEVFKKSVGFIDWLEKQQRRRKRR